MGNKEKNFVSAVIYIHNAENRIENFLKSIISILENNFEHSEVICINDCSDDNSLSAIRAASGIAKSTGVSVVNMSYFHGLEIAMNAGIDIAIGDFVFEFDRTIVDYDKAEIMKVYRRALQGYDIVSASPDKRETFTSSMFYKAFERFSDHSYKMRTESFRILSRRVINRIMSMNKTIPYRKAIYAAAGLKTDALIYETVGASAPKADNKEKRYKSRLAVDSLILFTEIGYKFAITMTILMMLISIFMVFYSVGIYVTANPVAGWTTNILFLSVSFFGLFGILTIIIKYLQILISLVFKRKQYSFESVEKLTK